jgi:predicted DNA-binding ArsR family transcriptional regulator
LSSPFKEKEKEIGEGRPQLSGLWKVLMLGGQWKVPMLNGQWKEKENHHFHLISLSL